MPVLPNLVDVVDVFLTPVPLEPPLLARWSKSLVALGLAKVPMRFLTRLTLLCKAKKLVRLAAACTCRSVVDADESSLFSLGVDVLVTFDLLDAVPCTTLLLGLLIFSSSNDESESERQSAVQTVAMESPLVVRETGVRLVCYAWWFLRQGCGAPVTS